MDAAVDILNQLAETWWPHVLHATWQSSLVAAVLLAMIALARRWPAHLRHGLILIALLKFAVPPMLALPTGIFSRFGPAVAGQDTARVAQLAPAASSEHVEGDKANSNPWSLSAMVHSLARVGWRAWLLAAHILGAATVAVWTVIQFVRVAALARRAQAVSQGPLKSLLERLRRRVGLRRDVRLLVSSEAVPPMAFGVAHPSIIIPASEVHDVPLHQLRVVLAHELAHHRRGDLWVNWLQVLLTVVWWFNPMLWLVNHAVRRTREDCCDDLLLCRKLTRNHQYCRALLEVASRMQRGFLLGGIPGFAERLHPLGGRMRRIMNPGLRRAPRSSWAVLMLLLILAGLVCPGLPTATGAAGESADVVPQPPDALSQAPRPAQRPWRPSAVVDRPAALDRGSSADVSITLGTEDRTTWAAPAAFTPPLLPARLAEPDFTTHGALERHVLHLSQDSFDIQQAGLLGQSSSTPATPVMGQWEQQSRAPAPYINAPALQEWTGLGLSRGLRLSRSAGYRPSAMPRAKVASAILPAPNPEIELVRFCNPPPTRTRPPVADRRVAAQIARMPTVAESELAPSRPPGMKGNDSSGPPPPAWLPDDIVGMGINSGAGAPPDLGPSGPPTWGFIDADGALVLPVGGDVFRLIPPPVGDVQIELQYNSLSQDDVPIGASSYDGFVLAGYSCHPIACREASGGGLLDEVLPPDIGPISPEQLAELLGEQMVRLDRDMIDRALAWERARVAPEDLTRLLSNGGLRLHPNDLADIRAAWDAPSQPVPGILPTGPDDPDAIRSPWDAASQLIPGVLPGRPDELGDIRIPWDGGRHPIPDPTTLFLLSPACFALLLRTRRR